MNDKMGSALWPFHNLQSSSGQITFMNLVNQLPIILVNTKKISFEVFDQIVHIWKKLFRKTKTKLNFEVIWKWYQLFFGYSRSTRKKIILPHPTVPRYFHLVSSVPFVLSLQNLLLLLCIVGLFIPHQFNFLTAESPYWWILKGEELNL